VLPLGQQRFDPSARVPPLALLLFLTVAALTNFSSYRRVAVDSNNKRIVLVLFLVFVLSFFVTE
jgi:hypothetical protein